MKVTLNTPALDKLEKQIKYLQKNYLIIGFIGNDKNDEGTKIYEYAFMLNEGTVFMPPRPFFDRAVLDANVQKEIKNKMKDILSNVYNGRISGIQALNQLGVYLVQRIKKSILSNDYAPLKSSTIKNKSRNKGNILREHDFMLKAVDFEIIRR